ncbi:MAG: hypothetical protein NT062_05415, partial [Proteobacteria bacterium]|nr:hypothetical protein [Pseudomonadota bacterium]
TLQSAQGFRGGLCRVKPKGGVGLEWRIIIDKRATPEERVATVATSLGRFDISSLQMPASIRTLLKLHAGKRPVAA